VETAHTVVEVALQGCYSLTGLIQMDRLPRQRQFSYIGSVAASVVPLTLLLRLIHQEESAEQLGDQDQVAICRPSRLVRLEQRELSVHLVVWVGSLQRRDIRCVTSATLAHSQTRRGVLNAQVVVWEDTLHVERVFVTPASQASIQTRSDRANAVSVKLDGFLIRAKAHVRNVLLTLGQAKVLLPVHLVIQARGAPMVRPHASHVMKNRLVTPNILAAAVVTNAILVMSTRDANSPSHTSCIGLEDKNLLY